VMARISHSDVVDAAHVIVKQDGTYRWTVGDTTADMQPNWVRAVREAIGAGFVQVAPDGYEADGALVVTGRGEKLRRQVTA
jgi:hypothetical protein